MSAAIIVAAQIAARQQTKWGARPFMILGTVLVTVGAFWVTRLDIHSSYVGGVLGPTMIFGFGMGCIFVPVMLTAVSGVAPHEAGAATGLLNTTQQVGGSLGLAILVTVFATAQRDSLKSQLPHPDPNQAYVHGMTSAFWVAVAFTLVAFVMAVFVVRPQARPSGAPPPKEATVHAG
jgi:MFS family permease